MEQIKACFIQEYNRKTLLKADKTICDKPIPRHNYHIYSYGALHELLGILSNKKPDDSISSEQDEIDRYAVRFIVDTDGTLWFTQEGERRETVPAHSEMRSRCYSAGNLFFSKDYQHIVKITNKSGHFKPHVGSLIWAIAALLSVDAPIAPEVILGFYPTLEPMSMTLDEVMALLPEGPLPQCSRDYKIETEADENINPKKAKHEQTSKTIVEPLTQQHHTLPSHAFEANFFSSPIATVTSNAYQTPPSSP